MNKPMVPFQLFRDLTEMLDVQEEFGARMAYEIAIDLCDGMFKGAEGNEIPAIYTRYLSALESNAASASFPGEREAYQEIISYVRDVANLPA